MIRRGLGHGARHKVAVGVIAFGQTLASEEDAPALVFELVTIPLEVADRALVDHRTHPDLPLTGVAHSDGPCRLQHLLQQAVGHVFLHIDPGEGRALLSGQAVGGAHDACDGSLQVAPCRHDAGILAAHLGDAGTRIRAARHFPINVHAHVMGTGEGDSREVGMVDQGLAHDASGPRDVVENAVREARVADTIRQQATGPGCIGRTLENDGVAGHEGRGHRSPSEGKGKIEGHDHPPYAMGLEHGTVVGTVGGQRIVGQGEIVTLVAFELSRVSGKEVRGLLRFSQRLHAVLAHLQSQGGADVVDPLLDQRCGSPDESDPLGVRGHAPGRKRPLCSRHRTVDIRGFADRKVPEDQALIYGAEVLGGPLALDVGAVDVHRVGGPQAVSRLGESSLEVAVHLFRGIEHRGIRELERHDHSNSVSWRSISASASIKSSSSMTRGGARMMRLPRVANETPSSRDRSTNVVREGWL